MLESEENSFCSTLHNLGFIFPINFNGILNFVVCISSLFFYGKFELMHMLMLILKPTCVLNLNDAEPFVQ